MTTLLSLVLLPGCSENSFQNLPDEELPTAAAPEGTAAVEEDEADEADEDASEPVADAGPDEEYAPLDRVVLDSTASYDPEGLDIVAVKWAVVSVPAGSTAVLDDVTGLTPAFFADLAGDYVFTLTVQNEDGVWDSTPDEVVVTTTPLEGFYVELAWDAATDLDLHLLDGSTGIFGDGDCNYCNLTPSWGAAGQTDDPSLDWDAIDGFGPETITIDAPASGVYDVQVHFYGEGGAPSCNGPCALSTATINVYLDGVQAASFTQAMSDQGQVWDVAEIEWPSGRITEIGGLGSTPRTGCF
jgi:hypothetical protein